MTVLLVTAALWVAFVNGANDTMKGVATLFGSGTTTYRQALRWAALTTLAGSTTSLMVGSALVRSFSGRGLVPDSLTATPQFLIGTAGGAALTVLIATLIGMPVSTTHALVGALIGTGLMAVGSRVNFGALGKIFVWPLLLSPVFSILLTLGLYVPLRAARKFLGVRQETCLCVGEVQEVVDIQADGTGVLRATGVTLAVGEMALCRTRYAGRVFGVSARRALESLHFLSAGAVSFARGLNDTPKIAALLIAARVLGPQAWLLSVAGIMAVGGLLCGRPVAETMSRRITEMNEGQGFAANVATALLVILASGLGLPASTTHVSVGALFGIGLANRRANVRQILSILTAWVTTLPLAAALAALIYLFVSHLA